MEAVHRTRTVFKKIIRPIGRSTFCFYGTGQAVPERRAWASIGQRTGGLRVLLRYSQTGTDLRGIPRPAR